MLELNDSLVTITRGDSGFVQLTILKEDGTEYTLDDGDTIKGQVRKGQGRDTDLVFDCTIVENEGAHIWYIAPSQTKDLEPGTYYYDMEVVKSSGDIFTFIPLSALIIEADITI